MEIKTRYEKGTGTGTGSQTMWPMIINKPSESGRVSLQEPKTMHIIPLMVLALLETHIGRQSPQRIEELVRIFIGATEMEIAFWDSALQS